MKVCVGGITAAGGSGAGRAGATDGAAGACRCGGVGIIGGTMNGVDSSGVVSAAADALARVMLFSDFIGSACAAMFGCAAA